MKYEWTQPGDVCRALDPNKQTSGWTKSRYSAQYKKTAIVLTKHAVGERLDYPVQPGVTLVCTRHYSGRSKAMDEHDNLRIQFKPVVDGIVKALWPELAPGRGDDKDRITIEYAQVKEQSGAWLSFELEIPEILANVDIA